MRKKLYYVLAVMVLFSIIYLIPATSQEYNAQVIDYTDGLGDELNEGSRQYIDPIAPAYFCSDCQWDCISVCSQQYELVDMWSHNTLFTNDCKVQLRQSTGARICVNCYRVWEKMGYHDCQEIHSKCSKGKYNVCPMQLQGSRSVHSEIQ